MIKRIGHINIRTPLLEETLVFYETLLGLERGPAGTMADQSRNAWLFDREGRAIIHVNMPPDDQPTPPGAGGRLDHVAFDCEDREEMKRLLDGAGIAYREFETAVAGLVQLTLSDPNGIRLELAFGTDAALRPARH